MNSIETEYSSLTPTWKLPSVETSSMYPGIYDPAYSPSVPKLGPNMSILNNRMHNSRYIPPITNRRTHPQTTNQQPGGHSKQSGPPSLHSQSGPPPPPLSQSYQHSNDVPTQTRNNGYSNQQIPLLPPIQKRVQIIDHNRQTPSVDYVTGTESNSSFTFNNHSPESNKSQQKSKDNNKFDSPRSSIQRSNNFNVHEYLYGLSAPNPGSYVDAYTNKQRRSQEDKLNPKAALIEYKNFVQNSGFGPAFGNVEYQTYAEKVDTEKKKKSYSNLVREINLYKVQEHKRIQNNGGQQRNRTYAVPLPKHRQYNTNIPHFLSIQEVRDFERRIKREHDANCKCSLHAKPYYSSA